MVHTVKRRLVQSVGLSLAALALSSASFLAQAEVPASLMPKIDKYKKQLVEWAATPALVAAVREANAKGPGDMNNAKWNDLDEKSPAVVATMSGPVASMVIKWEQDKNINKLFVRDQKGNVVVGSAKTLLFNAASRPSVSNALKGNVWHENAVKPDPTTQVKGVQVSVPVMDGGNVIGVLHTSVNAD
jgi:hypothetical protein